MCSRMFASALPVSGVSISASACTAMSGMSVVLLTRSPGAGSMASDACGIDTGTGTGTGAGTGAGAAAGAGAGEDGASGSGGSSGSSVGAAMARMPWAVEFGLWQTGSFRLVVLIPLTAFVPLVIVCLSWSVSVGISSSSSVVLSVYLSSQWN